MCREIVYSPEIRPVPCCQRPVVRGEASMCLDIGIVTCGPNEALIISGLFQGREGSLVVGGRAIVLPGKQ